MNFLEMHLYTLSYHQAEREVVDLDLPLRTPAPRLNKVAAATKSPSSPEHNSILIKESELLSLRHELFSLRETVAKEESEDEKLKRFVQDFEEERTWKLNVEHEVHLKYCHFILLTLDCRN